MRSGIANSIINSCIIIAIIFIIASSIGIIYGLSNNIHNNDVYSLTQQSWWFSYDTSTITRIEKIDILQLSGIAGLLIVSAIGTILFKFQYKKLGSTELFFFVLFLASMSFEAFRITSIILYLFELPIFLHTIVTRIVYFGRFMSIFFLLCSSLYACEIRYHKLINLAGFVLILSLAISYLISIDGARFLSTFLYKLDDELGIFLIMSSAAIFSIINFVIAAFKRNMRFAYIALAGLLLVTGQEIIFFTGNPILSLAALVSITCGIFIFYKEIDKIYLLV